MDTFFVRSLRIAGLVLLAFLCIDTLWADATLSWVRTGGGPLHDFGTALAIDPAGYLLTAGGFSGTARFGNSQFTSLGQHDVFVTRHDPSGNLSWALAGHGTGEDIGWGIASDSAGNIFVTGVFSENIQFGPFAVQSHGMNDVFLVKIDASGRPLWLKAIGGPGMDQGEWLAADRSGNIYVTGRIDRMADFGGAAPVSGQGSYDAFLAKYDTNGNLLWARSDGGPGYDFSWGVTLDPNDQPVITGFFSGTATWGSTTLQSAGGKDVFVAKYDANGNPLWARQFGGAGTDVGTGISCDFQGRIAVTGFFDADAAFSTQTLTNRGAQDVFVLLLDSSGNQQWVRQIAGSGDDVSYLVSSDAAGALFVTGYFYNSIDAAGLTLASRGMSDAFLVKFNSDGTPAWALSAGGGDADSANSMAVGPGGVVAITGHFKGEFRIGDQAVQAGSYDSYTALFRDGASAPQIVKDLVGGNFVAGDTLRLAVEVAGSGPFHYSWSRNGNVISFDDSSALQIGEAAADDSGIYQVVVSNSAGSASSSPVQVSVFPPSAVPIQVTVDGTGRVARGWGRDYLRVGRRYTAVAVPGRGQLFAGWTGSFSESNRRLIFTMQPGTEIVAHFIPNPFLPVQGWFDNGEPSDGSPHPSRIRLLSSGLFRLWWFDGTRYRILAGRFSADRSASIMTGDETISLSLDGDTSPPSIAVQSSLGGAWVLPRRN